MTSSALTLHIERHQQHNARDGGHNKVIHEVDLQYTMVVPRFLLTYLLTFEYVQALLSVYNSLAFVSGTNNSGWIRVDRNWAAWGWVAYGGNIHIVGGNVEGSVELSRWTYEEFGQNSIVCWYNRMPTRTWLSVKKSCVQSRLLEGMSV